MAGALRPSTTILTEKPPSAYLVVFFTPHGNLLGVVRIAAQTDEQVFEKAMLMVGEYSIDIWDGLRFVEHFPSIYA